MTEYDYSEEGRQSFLANQRRVGNWVRSTETASTPQLRSQPYSPPPMGSEAFRLQDYHSSVSHYHHSHAQTGHHSYHSQASRTSPSSSRNGSGSYFSSVTPSQSISQAPRTPSSTHSHSHSHSHFPTHSVSHHSSSHSSHPSSYHRSSHSHSHHHHHGHPTYMTPQPALPPNTYGYRTPGVIIIPRRGQSPRVVFY
ncbi:hypothetical protein C8R45DRAFT_1044977 [Mycena sanguinolenta]|nr:hypothetical protein C8R45DRAFT_1044977 [Mycena sanguinolenta]